MYLINRQRLTHDHFPFILFVFLLISHSPLTLASSDSIINIGTRFFVSNMVDKDNYGYQNDYADGNQISLNVGVQNAKYFAGYSIRVGKYDYISNQQFEGGALADNFEVRRVETDFLLGYYFWKNVALFIDYKTIDVRAFITPENQATLKFQGLGIGIASHYLLNRNWSLFGSFGVVPNGNKLVNYPDRDSSNSVSLEFGSAYVLTNTSNINFGLRTQKQEYFGTQPSPYNFTQEISGIFIGYNYSIR